MAFAHTNGWNRFRYSLWSPFYNLISPMTASLRRRSLALAPIRADDRILLVGAGTGLDLDYLPRDANVVATDLTPAMLEHLRRRAIRLKMPRVLPIVRDGQNLEFAPETFDLVVLHFIVAVIPDPVRCITQAAGVLRPGGRLLIMDKFAPDDRRPPLYLRWLNPILSVLVTDVTRQLMPLVRASGLELIEVKSLALSGLFKSALLRKREEQRDAA